MRYSVAVPALSQHSDAHDAPNVSPRRMKGAAKFLCRLNKFLGVDRLPLPRPECGTIWPPEKILFVVAMHIDSGLFFIKIIQAWV